MDLLMNFISYLKKDKYSFMRKRMPSYSGYELNITLILISDKDMTKKKENYRQVSLIIIETKILYKILANLNQCHIKKIIYHN
jgi:hypothetical protein